MGRAGEPCISCGYDLTGVTGGICPECGRRALSERDAIDHEAVGCRRERWIAWLVLLTGIGLIVGLCSGAMMMFGG